MTLDEIPAGSLKLIVATRDEELDFLVDEWCFDGHRVSLGVWVVYTALTPAEIREALGTRMTDERLVGPLSGLTPIAALVFAGVFLLLLLAPRAPVQPLRQAYIGRAALN